MRLRTFRILFLVGLLLLSSDLAAAEKGSIGLAVVPTVQGELVVLNVVERTPAAAAGMRPGDLLVRVNDFPLRGSDFAEVTERYLWGEAGTPVKLTFLRPGVAGTQTVSLKRVSLPKGGGTPREKKTAVPPGQ